MVEMGGGEGDGKGVPLRLLAGVRQLCRLRALHIKDAERAFCLGDATVTSSSLSSVPTYVTSNGKSAATAAGDSFSPWGFSYGQVRIRAEAEREREEKERGCA